MQIISKLKAAAAKLKKLTLAIYYAGKHPDLPGFTRFLIIFTVAYALSPIDLIPDFIPVLGYIDDLIILPLLISLCIRRIPEDIMQDSMKKAEEQPMKLGKNWLAATVIIIIWILILVRIGLIFLN